MDSTVSPVLIGLALDVSGSMSSSLQNPAARTLSRTDGMLAAVDDVIAEALGPPQAGAASRPEMPISLFGYAFGTRIPGHDICDLFQALQVSQQRNRFSSRWQMANALAAEKTVRVDELQGNWGGLRQGLAGFGEYLGGQTPMRQAFSLIQRRFSREAAGRNYAEKLLFVLSDGQSLDGDPTVAAVTMKAMGVTIISCFVCERDVFAPRRLVIDPPEDPGAKTMFEVASPLLKGSKAHRFLEECGWEIPGGTVGHGPKMFSQINHAEILNEFVQLVILPLRSETAGSLKRSGIPRRIEAESLKVPSPLPSARRDPAPSVREEPIWEPPPRRATWPECGCLARLIEEEGRSRFPGHLIAGRFLKTREDVEDAVQDAMLSLWRDHLRGKCCDCHGFDCHNGACCCGCRHCDRFGQYRCCVIHFRHRLVRAAQEIAHRRRREDALFVYGRNLDRMGCCAKACSDGLSCEHGCCCPLSWRLCYRDILRAMSRMSDVDQKLLEFFYLRQYHTDLIAEEFGISPSQANHKKRIALERLRRLLGVKMEEREVESHREFRITLIDYFMARRASSSDGLLPLGK